MKATGVEYRIVKWMKARAWYKGRSGRCIFRFVNVGKKEVIWRGRNIKALAKKYPHYHLRDETHKDPLRLMEEGCATGFVMIVCFERLTKRGWRSCVDPRPMAPVEKQPISFTFCG